MNRWKWVQIGAYSLPKDSFNGMINARTKFLIEGAIRFFSTVIRLRDIQGSSVHFAHRSLEGCLLEAFSSMMHR